MKQRLVTGIVAGAGYIAVLALGGYWFAALTAFLAVVGLHEYHRMNGLRPADPVAIVGYIGLAALVWPYAGATGWYELWGSVWAASDLLWALLFALFALTVFTKNRMTLDTIALELLGVLYLAAGFRYMINTRNGSEDGLWWTLLVLFGLWASDSGAYFVGRAIGRTKLWPAISPNKTVEGALGGVVLAVVVTLAMAIWRPELLSYGHAVLLGVCIAVVGQLGDLMQSAYKRVRGIKDSGRLLPGHGGVLDRTDSWLIVFPFLHIFNLLG